MHLTDLLDTTARRWPQKPALIEGSTVLSYAGLLERVDSFAAQLRAQSLAPGKRVGLHFPDGPAYVALTYALWRVGAVVVPVPQECTEEEISAITSSMELDAMITLKPGLGSVPLQPEGMFRRLSPAAASALPAGLDLAFIRFTSGTTSARKGVALSHETVARRVEVANKALQIGPEDTVVWCLPMSHHFLITIVLYLSQGATIVLARHPVARPFLEAVDRWRGTVLYAAPFHYSLLARDTSGAGIPSVRLAVSTTCALPQDVAEAFQRRFGRPLVQAFGVIELGLVALNVEDPAGRWNSVGRLLPDFEVRLLNPDEEGRGELAIRGPGMFDAYAAPWLPREQVLQDGWFQTGDIGRLDAEGFLFLLSRKTAVINLAGRKVFPEEIESILNRCPGVRESRVYGRPHLHLGETVEAELVLDPAEAGLDGVRAYCRAHLAPYKIPTRLLVVEALPRTPVTGKIVRAVAAA